MKAQPLEKPKRPRGRPPKNRRKTMIMSLNLDRTEFPNIEDMICSKNPQELYERYGIDLPRDLTWPRSSLRGLSQRTGAILEALARKRKPEETVEQSD